MTIDELRTLGEALEPFSAEYYEAVQRHWDELAKPIDGLGDMERLVARIGAIEHTEFPHIKKRTLIVFFSDNGIIEEGVSQSGAEVTHAVAEAMVKGSSTVCHMAREAKVDVMPVDIGMKGKKLEGMADMRIREGSRNIAVEPAMTMQETLDAIEKGRLAARQVIESGAEAILLGEMGIGNTSTATLVGCALLGKDPSVMAGRGAGLSDEKLAHKCEVLKKALDKHEYTEGDALQILATFGGYDIAGMVGAIIECAGKHVPIVLDGLITLSAALAADRIFMGIKDTCIASHKPREKMGQEIMKELKLLAPIDAALALGEGTGAVLLMPLLDVCLALYDNGVRFEGIGIDAYNRNIPR